MNGTALSLNKPESFESSKSSLRDISVIRILNNHLLFHLLPFHLFSLQFWKSI